MNGKQKQKPDQIQDPTPKSIPIPPPVDPYPLPPVDPQPEPPPPEYDRDMGEEEEADPLEVVPEGGGRPRPHLAIIQIGNEYRAVVQGFGVSMADGFRRQQAALLKIIGEEIARHISEEERWDNIRITQREVAERAAKALRGISSTWNSRISKLKGWVWVGMPDGSLRRLGDFFWGRGRPTGIDIKTLLEIVQNVLCSGIMQYNEVVRKVAQKYCYKTRVHPAKGAGAGRRYQAERVRTTIGRIIREIKELDPENARRWLEKKRASVNLEDPLKEIIAHFRSPHASRKKTGGK